MTAPVASGLDADLRRELRQAVSKALRAKVVAENKRRATVVFPRHDLVTLREAAGLTKTEVARRLDVPRWQVVSTERGGGSPFVSIDDYRRVIADDEIDAVDDRRDGADVVIGVGTHWPTPTRRVVTATGARELARDRYLRELRERQARRELGNTAMSDAR